MRYGVACSIRLPSESVVLDRDVASALRASAVRSQAAAVRSICRTVPHPVVALKSNVSHTAVAEYLDIRLSLRPHEPLHVA